MVTPRENILNVFRHKMPDWIPICGHCDPYNQPAREGMDPDLAAALKCVEWDDESTLQFSRFLGLDIMDYTMPPVQVTRQRVNLQVVRDGPDQISIWHTPHGDLREVQRTSDVGTTYLIEHLIKGAGDLPLLAEIIEDEILSPDNIKVEKIKDRQNKIGEDGVLMCFGPGTPLGMMYRVYTQVDTLAYLWSDARQALFDLFLVMEKNYRQVFELTARTDVDALVGMDDTSTGLVSPAMFHKVNIDVTNERADLAHQAGKLYFHHSCGHIRGLLPLYRQTRMDAVHMFTVPPTGDVTLKEGRELLGDQIAIIAGIQPLESSISSTPDHFRADVCNYLSGSPDDKLILNLVAFPHKTISQTRVILDECRKILNSR
jgi:hypothetical protein